MCSLSVRLCFCLAYCRLENIDMTLCPSGQGDGVEIHWALPAGVRIPSVSFVRREWWSWRCGRVGKLPGQRKHTKGAPAVSASRFQASPRPKGRFYMQGAARALAKASQSFALSRTRAWAWDKEPTKKETRAKMRAEGSARSGFSRRLLQTHSRLFSLQCRSSCKQRSSRTLGALCQMPHLSL